MIKYWTGQLSLIYHFVLWKKQSELAFQITDKVNHFTVVENSKIQATACITGSILNI